jgi:hypothetical protein
VMAVGVAVLLLAGFGWVLEPSVPDASEIDPPSTDGSTKEIAPLG